MVSAEVIRGYDSRDVQNSTGSFYSLGDLGYLPSDIRANIVNKAIEGMLDKRSTLEDLRIAEEARRLRHELSLFRNYVKNSDNYPSNAKKAIQLAFQEADVKIAPRDVNGRVSSRISRFGSIHIVSDYDGSITDPSKAFDISGFIDVDPNNYLTTFIPGSVFAEPLLKTHGRENFSEVFASIWQPLLRDRRGYELFRLAGRDIPLREGASEFFGYARENAFELTIASASFEPFVIGGLDRIQEADGASVFAVRSDSIISTLKGDLLLHLAQKNPTQATIFVGDGESDLPALEAKDIVACYFALEHSKFAKELETRKIPHFLYRNFHDIRLKLQEIKSV